MPQSLAAKAIPTKEFPILSNQAKRKIPHVPPQPKRELRLQQTFNVFIDIAGIKADVLLDTGSTTNMMTPNFARVSNTHCLELEVQMGLSLAVKGSNTKLNYGTWADVSLGHVKSKEYFDLVNLDHHDVVLGTPYFWAHGLTMSFDGEGMIACKGKRIDVPIRHLPGPKVLKSVADRCQFFRAS